MGLACAASKPAVANIIIQIDKPTQAMTVAVDGQVQYRWRVSTGATGYSTPVGSYTAFRMEVMHYSREWDNAGMPHAIFFTTRGHSIHGSDHPYLGRPASPGCVRLSLPNAARLYQLVTLGLEAMSIITIMTGTATRPFITALQYKAWIGLSEVSVIPAPSKVATASTP
jgi:lipoprotein-anchoring transpeptidase ErfK/SrfK